MIKIMIDSGADCRPGEFDLFQPIRVNLDGREYLDGVDIDADGFYEKLLAWEGFPQTSQPSPQDLLERFSAAREEGSQLIYITLSSGLSGTWQGACLARDLLGWEGIHVVDSLGATHMIRLLAEHARDLVAQGLEAGQIVARLEALRGRVRVLAGVDTLEYLYRGGRLSRGSAAVGQIAGIKPIVAFSPDGRVENIGKCLGRARAMQFILDRLAGARPDPAFPVYTLYTHGQENVELLEQKLRAAGYGLSGRRQIGPTIGAHVGPGVYGLAYVEQA